VKGISLDVDPTRPTCHVKTQQGTAEVRLADLKALFFVKDLTGRTEHKEGMSVEAGDARARGACTIDLEFADGERVVGLTVRFPPIKPFFFVVPVDGKSNNIRILVNRAAVKSMAQLPNGQVGANKSVTRSPRRSRAGWNRPVDPGGA
ncbi:MAG: DUF6982 domain-containing protein, partial [Gemmatimonadales bacterium]